MHHVADGDIGRIPRQTQPHLVVVEHVSDDSKLGDEGDWGRNWAITSRPLGGLTGVDMRPCFRNLAAAAKPLSEPAVDSCSGGWLYTRQCQLIWPILPT
ncbi:hypothetical protein I552_1063 [Mycobacterium xenopi 3993]|nr:hypothetical protein I552_1063 [Mycobacterium xenopi 3993]